MIYCGERQLRFPMKRIKTQYQSKARGRALERKTFRGYELSGAERVIALIKNKEHIKSKSWKYKSQAPSFGSLQNIKRNIMSVKMYTYSRINCVIFSDKFMDSNSVIRTEERRKLITLMILVVIYLHKS